MRALLAAAVTLVTFGAAHASDFQPQNSAKWSGLYLGGHVGYDWGSASVTDTTGSVPPGPFNYSPSGAFGGATAGYNLQLKDIVVGVEADLGYMSLNGTGLVPSSNPAYHQDLTLDSGMYATATGRLGWAVGDTLFYGKGGWAYLDTDARQTTTKPGYITTGTGAFNGTVYGGGVEHFISKNVTVKVEYLHFNFGSRGGLQTSISDPPIGFQYLNETSLVNDTVKVGVAVHF